MIFCPECWTKNLDEALFCENCWTKLTEDTVSTVTNESPKNNDLKDSYDEPKTTTYARTQSVPNKHEEVTLNVDFSFWNNYSNNQKILTISMLILLLSYFMPFVLISEYSNTTKSLFALSSSAWILYFLPIIYIAFWVIIYMSVTKWFSNLWKLKINLIMFWISSFLFFPFFLYIMWAMFVPDFDISSRAQIWGYLSLIWIIAQIVFSYFEVLTYYFRKK